MLDKSDYRLIEQDGFLRVNPLPDQSELADWYQSEYHPRFADCDGDRLLPEQDYVGNLSKLVLEALRQRRPTDLADLKMLDLGCGAGYFLRNFRAAGLDVYAVDYSSEVVKNHTPSLIESGRFQAGDILTKTFFKDLRFDFVLIKNVLEHVLDPEVCLERIKRYLSEDGIACIVVPNDFNFLHDHYLGVNHKESAGFFAPPDHLNYFNTLSLTGYLEKKRFQFVDAFCDYPLEQFLLDERTNYYKHKEFGAISHSLNVMLTDALVKKSLPKALNLFRCFFENGIGRNIYAFVQSV